MYYVTLFKHKKRKREGKVKTMGLISLTGNRDRDDNNQRQERNENAFILDNKNGLSSEITDNSISIGMNFMKGPNWNRQQTELNECKHDCRKSCTEWIHACVYIFQWDLMLTLLLRLSIIFKHIYNSSRRKEENFSRKWKLNSYQ